MRRRGCAGLENVQRIEAARFVVAWNKDRVSAAVDRSHNHEIVRQMETFDTEVRMPFAKLPPHTLLEALGCVRVTKDRPALSEKPADLDQGACVRGCASERREVGDDDVASLHHRNVLVVNRLPDIQRPGGRLDILIERWKRAQTV